MLMLWAVVFASCGLEAPPTAEAPVGERRDALTLPTTPIDVRRWLIAGVSFFPRTARSSQVVVMQDPRDATRFYAWGFDARSGNCAFFGSGSRTRDLDDLLAELAREAQLSVALDLDFTHGVILVIGKPPPSPNPPPPGGTDPLFLGQKAWEAAQKLEAASHFTP